MPGKYMHTCYPILQLVLCQNTTTTTPLVCARSIYKEKSNTGSIHEYRATELILYSNAYLVKRGICTYICINVKQVGVPFGHVLLLARRAPAVRALAARVTAVVCRLLV